jgi:hypothetical protein
LVVNVTPVAVDAGVVSVAYYGWEPLDGACIQYRPLACMCKVNDDTKLVAKFNELLSFTRETIVFPRHT